jgi:hypothetical protein
VLGAGFVVGGFVVGGFVVAGFEVVAAGAAPSAAAVVVGAFDVCVAATPGTSGTSASVV